jgi:hypothetical protein
MFQLKQLAIKGDEAALRQMYNIAHWATLWLNSLAEKKPDLFIPIAAEKGSWPMLWGPHPDDIKDNKALAERLTLGSRCGINLSQSGKTFSLKLPANEIAIYLVGLAHLVTQPLGARTRRIIASCRRFAQPMSSRDLEIWAGSEGRGLPPFSRATLSEWKQAVRSLLRFCYGEMFDEHPRLRELKGAVIGHAKDASGKQSPGVVRAAMLRKVLQALHSMAPLD